MTHFNPRKRRAGDGCGCHPGRRGPLAEEELADDIPDTSDDHHGEQHEDHDTNQLGDDQMRPTNRADQQIAQGARLRLAGDGLPADHGHGDR